MQISGEASRGWRADPVFLLQSRVQSQPMASDLSCVTLLPRPDRTGKLIAKVKRNKGATPSESLSTDRAKAEEREREKEWERKRGRSTGLSRARKREKETGRREKRAGERDVRSYRSEPRGLEIGFLAASRDRRGAQADIRPAQIFSFETRAVIDKREIQLPRRRRMRASGENRFG